MTTLVPHGSVFVEDTDQNGIFDIHSGDQVYDQDGLLLTTSKALEIDPSLSTKYGFYDQSGQPLNAQLRSQGYVMGFMAGPPPVQTLTNNLSKLKGPAAVVAVVAGAAVLAWNRWGGAPSDLEITPGIYIQPLNPTEPFVIPGTTPEIEPDETTQPEYPDFVIYASSDDGSDDESGDKIQGDDDAGPPLLSPDVPLPIDVDSAPVETRTQTREPDDEATIQKKLALASRLGEGPDVLEDVVFHKLYDAVFNPKRQSVPEDEKQTEFIKEWRIIKALREIEGDINMETELFNNALREKDFHAAERHIATLSALARAFEEAGRELENNPKRFGFARPGAIRCIEALGLVLLNNEHYREAADAFAQAAREAQISGDKSRMDANIQRWRDAMLFVGDAVALDPDGLNIPPTLLEGLDEPDYERLADRSIDAPGSDAITFSGKEIREDLAREAKIQALLLNGKILEAMRLTYKYNDRNKERKFFEDLLSHQVTLEEAEAISQYILSLPYVPSHKALFHFRSLAHQELNIIEEVTGLDRAEYGAFIAELCEMLDFWRVSGRSLVDIRYLSQNVAEMSREYEFPFEVQKEIYEALAYDALVVGEIDLAAAALGHVIQCYHHLNPQDYENKTKVAVEILNLKVKYGNIDLEKVCAFAIEGLAAIAFGDLPVSLAVELNALLDSALAKAVEPTERMSLLRSLEFRLRSRELTVDSYVAEIAQMNTVVLYPEFNDAETLPIWLRALSRAIDNEDYAASQEILERISPLLEVYNRALQGIRRLEGDVSFDDESWLYPIRFAVEVVDPILQEIRSMNDPVLPEGTVRAENPAEDPVQYFQDLESELTAMLASLSEG